MTTAVQRRRGTNTEHASFTGLEGEISVNTTNESVHVHDGSTAGGFELMRADGANSTVTLGDISGVTAGTGLSGGGTTGTVTLDIDGTVATLAGTQTFTNKTLTSPILNTPTIGTSFTIGGATITETELEILDGATVTTTELNYVDGVTSSIQTQIDAKAPLASPSFTGNVSVGGTVDGRDVATDGTKLDGIEASADVTDTANVTAAGAVMDSELTSEASVKALNQGVATTDSPAFAGLTVDTDTLAVDSTNNRVGIGTASPSRTLHSKGGSGISTTGKFEAGGSQVYVQLSSSGQADGDSGYIGYDSSKNLTLFTDNTERMRINSSGNVGIGTSSPTSKLHLYKTGTSDNKLTIQNGQNAYASILDLRANNDGGAIYNSLTSTTDGGTQHWKIWGGAASSTMAFSTGGSERMRIDSSGNLLVGNTDRNTIVSNGASGVAIGGDGFIGASRTNESLVLNREDSDGNIAVFRKDGTTVGSISTYGGNRIAVGNGDTNLAFIATSDVIVPAYQTSNRDNAIDLGTSSVRFDDIYATNGTIQTSDRNEKQDIAELSDAEQRVAVACKGLMRKFRWKDSVAEKGNDARIHFGIIAQDLQDAFEAEGLDADDYAMFISTTWTDEETNEEKTRMGVRYSELLAFIIAAI